MKNSNIQVEVATEDADTLIVNKALQLKSKYQNVCIVGNDVDLLVLCIGLTPVDEEMYFLKDVANNKPSMLYSSKDNISLQPFILFAHAFVGCDTTNALFKIGKRGILKSIL